jgi:uncharacterized OsmC-like protein
MNAEELRARQAPLKSRYKEDAAAALVTLRAVGRIDREALGCVIETARPGVPVGLHAAAGGDGTMACSGDMLLEALVGCAGVTLAAVSTAMGLPLTGGTVTASGDVDFRGTLGVAKDVPIGFRDLRLEFDLEGDLDAAQATRLVELTERYCVILQTLRTPPKLSVHIVRAGTKST